MVNDTIADMLTRIRNARGKRDVLVPFTKLCQKIALVLLNNGFVSEVSEEGEGVHHNLRITLRYDSRGKCVISGLRRISSPGLRMYSSAEDMPKVLNGLGIAVVSTSKGVMTDAQCRREHVGGEVLCFVW